MAKEKSKAGRPSKLIKLDLNQVEMLSGLGLADAQMANFFGVCRATWHNWKKKNKEFLDSIKRGKDREKELLKASFFHLAVGYSHPEEKIFLHEGKVIRVDTIRHYPPNASCLIFAMKNLWGWRNEQVNEEKEEAFIEAMRQFAKIMAGAKNG